MYEMEDVKVERTGVRKVIEVMFKHERKQRNEGLVYYVPTKFPPMFSRYISEIYQDTVAAGNVQFLKKWNKSSTKHQQEQRQRSTPSRL